MATKLAVIKTRQNEEPVADFIAGIADDTKRQDSLTLLKLMQKATKEQPKMWGKAMIGFGKKLYTSPASGRQVEWFVIGFSPRKVNLSIHLLHLRPEDLERLGKHKAGVGCLYINKLADVDIKVLEEMIVNGAKGQ